MFSFPFLSLPTFWPLTFYDAHKPNHSMPISQKATPPHIPLELVLSIVESAASDVPNDERIDLLQSCSLVCRSWSTASQKLLFARVTLRTQKSLQSFMSAVDRTTSHGQTLGDAVTHLRVVLDHNQPSGLHQHSFASAVTVCPNLHELDISLYGHAEPGKDVVGDLSRLRRSAPPFDEQTLALLKSGPNIKALHFNNWSENQHSIFQLLSVWSSLEFLSIGGTLSQHLQGSPAPFPCKLHQVRFNFQTSPTTDFVKWLLHNSASSLRVIRFDRDPSCDLFEHLTTIHGPNLHSISFPSYSSPELAFGLQKCEQLRELRTETPPSSSSLYRCIPDNLEHLAFGLDQHSPLASVIDLVKSRNTLKTITVQVWDGAHQHTLLTPLKIACAYHGVDLRMTNNLGLFRTTRVSLILLFFKFVFSSLFLLQRNICL